MYLICVQVKYPSFPIRDKLSEFQNGPSIQIERTNEDSRKVESRKTTAVHFWSSLAM